MVANDIRKFDLYNLFSVLIPGLALIIGLAPFLPQWVDITSINFLVPFLVVGFVVGRVVHSGSVFIEDYFDRTTHRQRFADELMEPELLTKTTVGKFCSECADTFGAIDDGDLEDGAPASTDVANTIYVLVRSHIHIDSRGRSRSFQAIYSFNRSMWLVTVTIALAYVIYGNLDAIGFNQGVASFQTFLGALGLDPGIVTNAGYVVALVGWIAFSQAREVYQGHYVEYLITDFLTLRTADYPEAIVVAETNSQKAFPRDGEGDLDQETSGNPDPESEVK